MALWEVPELIFDEDAVLRGQGADPAQIRKRSPKLIQISCQALQEGRTFLEPLVVYKKLKIESITHETVFLEGGKKLSGPLLINHLSTAEYIVLILCTIGNRLEEYTIEKIKESAPYGFALDGVGSAAVEALANSACRFFEDEAAADGYESSIPLSPGMIGWDVSNGQQQIFDILDASSIGVTLQSTSMMIPRKSLTTIIGFGEKMELAGRTCDFCSMSETCKYKETYQNDN